jgi:hypothetical protein
MIASPLATRTLDRPSRSARFEQVALARGVDVDGEDAGAGVGGGHLRGGLAHAEADLQDDGEVGLPKSPPRSRRCSPSMSRPHLGHRRAARPPGRRSPGFGGAGSCGCGARSGSRPGRRRARRGTAGRSRAGAPGSGPGSPGPGSELGTVRSRSAWESGAVEFSDTVPPILRAEVGPPVGPPQGRRAGSGVRGSTPRAVPARAEARLPGPAGPGAGCTAERSALRWRPHRRARPARAWGSGTGRQGRGRRPRAPGWVAPPRRARYRARTPVTPLTAPPAPAGPPRGRWGARPWRRGKGR